MPPFLTDLYAEEALWRCCPKVGPNSGQAFHINGALAQILKQYPHDYELCFLEPRLVAVQQK